MFVGPRQIVLLDKHQRIIDACHSTSEIEQCTRYIFLPLPCTFRFVEFICFHHVPMRESRASPFPADG